MASESTTSNVLLTGQSAYVKKNGSMVNHGTIERQNALSAYSLNTEGYIGPNSVLHGTDLAETNEYLQCESVMRSYLGENWEEDPQERTIYTNANKIKTLLLPGENNMNTLANSIMPDYQDCNYIYWYGGTGYFNTGINATNVYSLEFTFRPYSTVTNAYSSLLSGVLDNFTIGTGGTSGTTYSDIYLRWRTAEKLSVTTALPSFSAASPVTITIKNGKCEINGVYKCDIDTTQAVSTATGNIYIGNNSSLTRAGNLYFHGLKLYNSAGQLLADMIPVYSDSTYCIFDKISKKMIYNSGTGSISGSTKTNYTLLEYLETNGTGSFRLTNSNMLNYILNYPQYFGFELDFMPLDTFDTTSTYGEKPYMSFGTMGEGDSTHSKFMCLCARKDFPNGAINVGYSCQPVDARLQLGKRQTISFINGVLTRPDGSTVNLGTPDVESGISRNYIQGRIGASFEPETGIVIDNPYTNMRVYDLKIHTRNMTYHFEPVLYNNVAMFRYKTSATSVTYSTLSYGGTYCKPGPIKIEEGGNE